MAQVVPSGPQTCAKAPQTQFSMEMQAADFEPKNRVICFTNPNPPSSLEIIIAIVGAINQDYPWHLCLFGGSEISSLFSKSIPQDSLCGQLKETFNRLQHHLCCLNPMEPMARIHQYKIHTKKTII